MNNVLALVEGQLSLIRAYMEAATESYADNPSQSNKYRFLAEQTWESTHVLLGAIKTTWPVEFKNMSPYLHDLITNLELEFG